MTRYETRRRTRVFLDTVEITHRTSELNDASPGLYYVKVYPEGDDVSYEDAYWVEGSIVIVMPYDLGVEFGRAILPQVPVV